LLPDQGYGYNMTNKNQAIAAVYEAQAKILTQLAQVAWKRCNMYAGGAVSRAALCGLRAKEQELVAQMTEITEELAALASGACP
jgi:hypothetical protein